MKKNTSASQQGDPEDDVQARYEQLVKSGATAISSDMLFGREEQMKQASNQGGRWSQPAVTASLQALGEKAQAAVGAAMSRSSVGSNNAGADGSEGSGLADYTAKGKELASGAYAKGGELASGAYVKGGELANATYGKASYAKHAALDWITSMTASSNNQLEKRDDDQ